MKGWLGQKKNSVGDARSPVKDDAKSPKDAKDAADKRLDAKRTMSVGNILRAALTGKKEDASKEHSEESAAAEDELEYQSCSLPVNVFDVNDEATLNATSLVGVNKKRTYELPVDTRSMSCDKLRIDCTNTQTVYPFLIVIF